MATHYSLLARRIPWTEGPGGLIHGVTESGTSERPSMHMLTGEVRNKDENQCDPKSPSAPGCIPWSSPPTSGTGKGRGTSRIQPTRSYFCSTGFSLYLFV